MKTPDGLIFDMDGTLWDALDTYVESWNRAFVKLNLNKRVDRDGLGHMMGWEGRKVLATILPEFSIDAQDEIYATVNAIRNDLITEVGGQLYDGVREGLEQLSGKYELFIVSNCPKGLISMFTRWAGIQPFIKDEMEYGMNFRPKSENIMSLVSRHSLQNPVYVGDTDGDRLESEHAGVPFVFVSYGFGATDKYELKFDSFNELVQYFLGLE